ncbi:MAG: hypothetical protein R3250_13370, partial [Melioribacteraceae bacterium]|nr:hypothetical protein [Melioribacteraceae bacterium]
SKLAPRRVTALLMGGWFMATAIGNKLSGVLSGLFFTIENKAIYFLINGAAAAAVAVILFFMLNWLKKVVKEHTGDH